MKLLLDMNLSPSWAPFLEDAGFSAVHWNDVGDPRAPDVELMRWAGEHGFVVFTHDLDFGALLATTRAEGPSVVQIRAQDVSPSGLGPFAVRVLRRHADTLERGALVVIDRASARVRILPLRV